MLLCCEVAFKLAYQPHGDGFELPLGFPCQFCTFGMFAVVGVAHQLLADFRVSLPLLYALVFGYLVAVVDYFFAELRIGGKSGVVLLNGSVGQHEIRCTGLCIVHPYAVGEDFLNPLFSNSFPEVDEITRVAGKLVLKENPPAKILHVGVHDPGGSKGLISQIIKVFQKQTAHHKANRMVGLPVFEYSGENSSSK